MKEVQRSERGRRGKYVVVEEWYGVVDKSDIITSYDDKQQFEVGCFACENEVRFFIAELVMKLNDPWIQRTMESLEKICRKVDKEVQAAVQPPFIKNEVYIQLKEEITRRQIAIQASKPASKELQSVYVFKTNFDTVKIGISQNVRQRKNQVEKQNELEIVYLCRTAPMPNAREIESACHKHFNTHALGGEFFNVLFEAARDYLSTLAPITDGDSED